MMLTTETHNTIANTPKAKATKKPSAAALKVSASKKVAKASKAQQQLHDVPQWKRLRTIAAALDGLAEDNPYTVDNDVVAMLGEQIGPNLNAFDSVAEHGGFGLTHAPSWSDVLDIEHILTLLGTLCTEDGVPASVVDFLAKKLSEALDSLAAD